MVLHFSNLGSSIFQKYSSFSETFNLFVTVRTDPGSNLVQWRHQTIKLKKYQHKLSKHKLTQRNGTQYLFINYFFIHAYLYELST